MKIRISNCQIHAPYHALTWGKPKSPNFPGFHMCPECVIAGNHPGSTPNLACQVSMLRERHAAFALAVADPVSGKVLRGPAIAGIAENLPYLQVSLHPDWWSDSGRVLGPECLMTPEGYSFTPSSTVGDACGSNLSVAIAVRASHPFGTPILVWEPVSRRLISLDPDRHVCADGREVKILLPKDWVRQ